MSNQEEKKQKKSLKERIFGFFSIFKPKQNNATPIIEQETPVLSTVKPEAPKALTKEEIIEAKVNAKRDEIYEQLFKKAMQRPPKINNELGKSSLKFESKHWAEQETNNILRELFPEYFAKKDKKYMFPDDDNTNNEDLQDAKPVIPLIIKGEEQTDHIKFMPPENPEETEFEDIKISDYTPETTIQETEISGIVKTKKHKPLKIKGLTHNGVILPENFLELDIEKQTQIIREINDKAMLTRPKNYKKLSKEEQNKIDKTIEREKALVPINIVDFPKDKREKIITHNRYLQSKAKKQVLTIIEKAQKESKASLSTPQDTLPEEILPQNTDNQNNNIAFREPPIVRVGGYVIQSSSIGSSVDMTNALIKYYEKIKAEQEAKAQAQLNEFLNSMTPTKRAEYKSLVAKSKMNDLELKFKMKSKDIDGIQSSLSLYIHKLQKKSNDESVTFWIEHLTKDLHVASKELQEIQNNLDKTKKDYDNAQQELQKLLNTPNTQQNNTQKKQLQPVQKSDENVTEHKPELDQKLNKHPTKTEAELTKQNNELAKQQKENTLRQINKNASGEHIKVRALKGKANPNKTKKRAKLREKQMRENSENNITRLEL